MTTKSKHLAKQPEFQKWFAMGRSVRVNDGQGNELTLVEALAQVVEEQGWERAKAGENPRIQYLVLGAGQTIRTADDTPQPPKPTLKASYGVADPSVPEYPPAT